MQITILGTSAMLPTKDRNPSAIFLNYKAEGILFDCGEGTQRQMKIAGIPFSKITKLLITHWHGDHVLGIPGLIQSMGGSDYQGTLEIYAPKGCKKHFEHMLQGIVFDFRINVKFMEVTKKAFFKGNDFNLEALPLDHKIPCLGYSFIENEKRKIDMIKAKKMGIPEGPLIGEIQEGKSINFKGKKIDPDEISSVVKGKKITFITDTTVCKNAYELAKDSDLLICESSYASNLKAKALEYKHLTAHDAALIASKSNAKKLVLTHFSARYKNTLEIEEDARTLFDNIICANDFTRINL